MSKPGGESDDVRFADPTTSTPSTVIGWAVLPLSHAVHATSAAVRTRAPRWNGLLGAAIAELGWAVRARCSIESRSQQGSQGVERFELDAKGICC